ncbi:MAG: radical SAM protein [Desulfobacterales bacterium]
MATRKVPGQLVIQFTDHCNGSCPQCGMRKSNPFERAKLDLELARRTLRAAAARDVAAVSFTGGEPLLHLKDLADLMIYAGKLGIPFIRTGTNGFLFNGHRNPGFTRRMQSLAKTLAATSVRNFWISIDSIDPLIHDRMRGFSGLMAGIRKALPIFHAAGIYPSANLGLNRNMGGTATQTLTPSRFSSSEAYHQAFYRTYREALRRFYQMAINLGFTIVNTCYPMSIEPQNTDPARALSDNRDSGGDKGDKNPTGLEAVYAATASDRVVHFSDAEKRYLFQALLAAIPEFRSRIRVFTPLSGVLNLSRQHSGLEDSSYPCRGGIDFFFIDAAQGDTFPCGYRGHENLGKFWNLPARMPQGRGCRQCDWECFRDPSELLGPLLMDAWRPWHTASGMLRRKDFFRYWAGDLAYYRACGFFNGRRPPNYRRMARAGGTSICHTPRTRHNTMIRQLDPALAKGWVHP